ncbi:lytic transglycosylase domain-containing protein [Bradyrhizobium sp.]|uniref:lytic transglycosylase domain-containing protein n=1 Tax=Bradyrhizobium sp. TaxID=376 RepID=UPI002D37F04A|nr:lytic transglycosylase domain-containing protein [Bradyrhizobium sp.]HZR76167.1 lytic transglycosylase domain-containing protein [Bradyrhizobium sp.]
MPGSISRVSGFLQKLLLFAAVAVSGWPALAADAGEDQTQATEAGALPQTPEAKPPDPTPPNPKPPNLCEALGAAATANELPVDFFTRLIWQESRFKPDAVSQKGAQGIAQFMPATARENGLENPFNAIEAITKSGQLLRDLRREFGNLGLAAAAYNAGPARVHDWLGSHRPLPRETRAYVRIVTGRSAEEWATGKQTGAIEMPTVKIPCDLPVTALNETKPGDSQPKTESVKPWGVEIVGGTTRANALARYRDWQPKFASLVEGRETNVVIRGVIGQAGAARVRIGDDTRAGAEKLCASLKAAGTYCDVMRN